MSLSLVLDPGSPLVPELLEDDDWLVRWSRASATSTFHHEPEAATLRARLAADPHPLIAGEAKQQLANIAARDARFAGITGWTFYSPGEDEGDAPYFGKLAKAFVERWPASKMSYTLDELRAFVLAETSGRRPNVET